MILHIATDLEMGLRRLGEGSAQRGQATLAALLYGALEGTAYARLPAFASIDAVLEGDLRDLVQAGEGGAPLLLWATNGGDLAGAFWGYPLAHAPEGLRRSLREEAARALETSEDRLAGLPLDPEVRASAREVEVLLKDLSRPTPPLFYADWIVVAPPLRRSGLARLLWTWGLKEALEAGGLEGYVSRTLGTHTALLERMYCRDVGGRAYFAWEDGALCRVAFGGTGRAPIDAALLRARRELEPQEVRRCGARRCVNP